MWGKYNKGSGKGKACKGKGQSHNQTWAWDSWAPSWSSASTDTWSANREQRSQDWNSWGSEKGKAAYGDDKGGKGKSKEWIPRLEGRYALAKAVLRPYADDKGSAIYSQAAGKEAFSKASMRRILDSKNSELCRRPSVGLSTIGSSVCALQNMLQSWQSSGNKDPAFLGLSQLAHLLGGDAGKHFKAAQDILARDRVGRVSLVS